jgi:hypothetical protein
MVSLHPLEGFGLMAVTVTEQVVEMGAGLRCVGWIIWDGNVQVGWDTNYDAAVRRACDVREQKEHRDGE